MANDSYPLLMALQILDENPDQWGDVLNASALELIEDRFDTTEADVTLANVTLDKTSQGDALGGAPHFRYGIINITSSSDPGAARSVSVDTDIGGGNTPNMFWLVINNTVGGQTITFKTLLGNGVNIPAGEAQFVYCDGTDILAASVAVATSASTAALATDANALGGVAAADYAQKAVAQTFTKGQVTQRQAVSSAAGFLDIDCADSNAFFMTTTENFTINAPTNATTGQQFTVAIQQGGGGPHTISFAASTFIAPGGVAPELSTVAGDVDYLAFELVTGLAAPFSGDRWVVSLLKDLGDL